ncbi:hypothetical protein [Elizabethkingia anophelis]|uniref:hypothetical protein n=1 Tax=Elizabethkingia anophelis TaxID=1117645 RepID=UPI00063AF573|nr:hypothetical protein [Elizabethkingia anophelis]AKH95406.1 hypothetical protein M876_12600 [Elizabethkingia anophelis FMS-007]
MDDLVGLRLKFESRLAENVDKMKKIRPFTQLQRLLNEYGYFEGARRLINGKETSGLADLILVGKSHLSIEYLALSEEFQSLFTDGELKKCRRKLGCSK